MLLFIGNEYTILLLPVSFNTSHVTLYRHWFSAEEKIETFQYISCYSLSSIVRVASALFLSFQYISCYSLSKSWNTGKQQRIAFQYISCYSLSDTGCKVIYFPTVVSIHLMLLFIAFLIVKIINYIFVSIHLMLLFIA